MSTSSVELKVWRTTGRTLRYSASSSVYLTGMESGSGTSVSGIRVFRRISRSGGGGFDGAVNFFVRGSGGQICFDDLDFFGLFFGEVVASAFGELFDGFVALLDESLENLQRFEIVERAHLFDFFMFEGALHHAQDAQPQLVFLLHGRGQITLDAIDVTHSWVSPRQG